MSARLRERHDVVVVGGGQAGLSMSRCLRDRGIEHVVLERERPGHEWRERRWDSFCLVTPNWQCQLPGHPYAGEDPHGFMDRDEIVAYIEGYARSFDAPVIENAEATALRPDGEGGFELETSIGETRAEHVVVANGPYHAPRVPRRAERLPDSVTQLHSSEYRRPEDLPDGGVLVVGTGQSGGQIAEDLHLAGRPVHLCVGGAPRVARFYRGRDVTDWLDDMSHYDVPVVDHPLGDRIRLQANHYVTGRGGGRDIDLRQFALEGMRLYGRLATVDGPRLSFEPDLRENLDAADKVAEDIKDVIDEHVESRGLDAPTEARYVPVWEPDVEPSELDLDAEGASAVVWCTGFSREWPWIEAPVFDGRGYPTHVRGVTSVEGLYFLGLPWLHTWGSGRFSGVARDADLLAERIERGAAVAAASPAYAAA